MANAFNAVQREAVLDGVRALAPGLLPWARLCLQPASLLCGPQVVSSSRGVQQGDPLGPLFSPLAVHRALNAVPGGAHIQRWYLDDGILLGPPPALEAALGHLMVCLRPLGLSLNLRKTTLWGPGSWPASSLLASAIRVPLEEGACVLGVLVTAPAGGAALSGHDGHSSANRAEYALNALICHRVSRVRPSAE